MIDGTKQAPFGTRFTSLLTPGVDVWSQDLWAAAVLLPSRPSTAGPPRVISSLQLMSRHWVISNAAGQVSDEVRGEAVVGLYPLLRPGESEFVYESCTSSR